MGATGSTGSRLTGGSGGGSGAGPVEATAIGNVLVQARAAGFADGDLDRFAAIYGDAEVMRWLGDGPSRVWKNRRQGVSLGVWENTFNRTATGYESWVYPEFKGYYANVRWLTLRTAAGPITVALEEATCSTSIIIRRNAGLPPMIASASGTSMKTFGGSTFWARRRTAITDIQVTLRRLLGDFHSFVV